MINKITLTHIISISASPSNTPSKNPSMPLCPAALGRVLYRLLKIIWSPYNVFNLERGATISPNLPTKSLFEISL